MDSSKNKFHPLKNLGADLSASIVVFLVAVPLCLGIALASGAPLFAGLIAGIVGGVVVGSLSGSAIGVSGPAAGLAIIVLTAIQDLGDYQSFLVAVVFAGVLQVIIGFAKGGTIANYFPSSVIMGMLAAIGIIIFLKQIPHAFGYDVDPIGDMDFHQADQQNTFSELINMLNYISPGAVLITAISLTILLLWDSKWLAKIKFLKTIPGPLVAVASGIGLALIFNRSELLKISSDHFVQIPISESLDGFFSNFTLPNWAALSNPDIYITAVVIAVVASLETLLSVEAADKLDPHKRLTPTNRELKAQGVGNIISGLIGGLPITQVVVRTSANVQSGGVTKASTVSHGLLILLSIISIPFVLNLIPLATLASILLLVGYKLAKPALFVKIYKQGFEQFVPFVATIVAIVTTDLLIGLGIGLLISVLIILYNSFKMPYMIQNKNEESIKIELAQEVTFLNKAAIQKALGDIPANSKVEIDISKTAYMHHDVKELIDNFKVNSQGKNIQVQLVPTEIEEKVEVF